MSMIVYSYYYGASAGKGIGIQAQSRELENQAVSADLKALSSYHALESSEHSGEMLSYLLSREGFDILGLSYIEPAKNSGYNRSAPCSLQYVIPGSNMNEIEDELGKIINFVSFQKPESASPAPLSAIPQSESGYYYHNSASVMAPLVDGLLRVASSKDIMLVALPKGKSSDYATARFVIAEAMNYLNAPVRSMIRFFTGLPVPEGVTDPRVGFDNAAKMGANVIFCPAEYYRTLKSCYNCIGLDMDHPGGQTGTFANFITHVPDVSAGLSMVYNCLPQNDYVTYETFNKAAQTVMSGRAETIDTVRRQLDEARQQCADLSKKNGELTQQINSLQRSAESFRRNTDGISAEKSEKYAKMARKAKRSPKLKLIIGAVILVAISCAATWFIKDKMTKSETPNPENIVEQADDKEATSETPNPENPVAQTDGKEATSETPNPENSAAQTDGNEANGGQETVDPAEQTAAAPIDEQGPGNPAGTEENTEDGNNDPGNTPENSDSNDQNNMYTNETRPGIFETFNP